MSDVDLIEKVFPSYEGVIPMRFFKRNKKAGIPLV